MNSKQLTLLFGFPGQEQLGKDPFLVPYYLGKRYGYNVTIVYPWSDENYPESLKGVRLIPLKLKGKHSSHYLYRKFNFICYLIRESKNIDVFMRFHFTSLTMLMVIIYKICNRKGFVYVKGDIDANLVHEEEEPEFWLKRIIKNILYRSFAKSVDLVSCETVESYNKILKSASNFYQFKSKLFLMPNGFDEEQFQKLNIYEKPFANKENLIITVGRLGTEQKNTEMFLDALEKIDLKSWKVCLVGPIEKSFKKRIDTFFRNCPDKKNTVIFTGPIYDKKELWEYYNRSKVFVLTSRWESYALVLNEAKRLGNYLISTEVGAIHDLIESGKYGETIAFGDVLQLTHRLQDIIDEKTNIDVYRNFDPEQLSWNSMIQKIDLKTH